MDNKTLRKHFIKGLYTTLDGVISPTPYLEISDGDTVKVKFLDGKGKLPNPKSIEITILDLDIAKLFLDDFHLLYEGVTGVGKTYTSDALFDAVFGPDGHYTLRLSGGVLGSSALEPFTTTTFENGIPKTRIDHEKCAKYGALFIDEINRGDSQEVLQVVDGRIHLNEETGYLRIPIQGTDRHKKLAIIAAMNPADAQHSSAVELDIAGENRFLKFKYPNGVAEAASSQLEKKTTGELHDQFWKEFSKRTGLKGNWKELYPKVTDPEQSQVALDGAAKEFIDVALGYVGHNPIETYERNAELMKQGGISPLFSIRNDNDLKKIIEAQNTLKHGFVRRDLRKIRDLSGLLGFIKSVKKETYEPAVSIDDVAASIGIMLESKTVTGTPCGQLINLVNDAQNEYNKMRKQLNVPEGYGIRQAILDAAINAGLERGIEAYENTLKKDIAKLNTQTKEAAEAVILSRVLADLVVLQHFSATYKADIASALKDGGVPLEKFVKVYDEHKAKSSIYEHRLDSIV